MWKYMSHHRTLFCALCISKQKSNDNCLNVAIGKITNNVV